MGPSGKFRTFRAGGKNLPGFLEAVWIQSTRRGEALISGLPDDTRRQRRILISVPSNVSERRRLKERQIHPRRQLVHPAMAHVDIQVCVPSVGCSNVMMKHLNRPNLKKPVVHGSIQGPSRIQF